VPPPMATTCSPPAEVFLPRGQRRELRCGSDTATARHRPQDWLDPERIPLPGQDRVAR